ncbi:hypothetical protein C2E21_6221 [Chlorella sorokiniana]|uniref:Uncharacterized protein n=1 Tax=Chlorella sorokiniana TaxID=3076 RepID=A0A2P6TLD5_CHLSO|nr:hypothetical protein C2E21_6221 [Chlorella sorokiniana]|eukprot:PRW45099.1 hypothetical protein C2E21_6221 [Chlorella sorokiniana]
MSGQDLAVRLVALGAVAVVANVPLGMWRAHLKKLSPAWFVSIHASIPAVIAARKALTVPRAAVFLSIACAVVGQQIGVKLERRRLAAKKGGRGSGGAAGGTSAAAGGKGKPS